MFVCVCVCIWVHSARKIVMCVHPQLFEASGRYAAAAAAISLTVLSVWIKHLCSVFLEPRPKYEWQKRKAGTVFRKVQSVSKFDSTAESLFGRLLRPFWPLPGTPTAFSKQCNTIACDKYTPCSVYPPVTYVNTCSCKAINEVPGQQL